jgi:putative transposase
MRKPRKLIDGATYHVTSRINRGELLFSNANIKELLLKTLLRARKKHRFTLTNFCIMNNHIHFMIHPLKNEILSKIMQWILATFAINYNKQLKISGHVWYDRFHSTVINSLLQFIRTFLYIGENPVKANLVNHANQYEYGGIYHMIKGMYEIIEPPEILLKLLFPEYSLKAITYKE